MLKLRIGRRSITNVEVDRRHGRRKTGDAGGGDINRRTGGRSGVARLIRDIVIVCLVAVAIRIFLFEPFNILSGSMMPNLLTGDYIFVSKYPYGYSRYTIAFGQPWFEGRWPRLSLPQRGDVIVFKLPRDEQTDYIKRVIGLPGDTVQMDQGILYINGNAVDRQMLPAQQQTNLDGILYRETLPNGVSYHILEQSNSSRYDNTPLYEVPEGHYFIMGDNRDNSLDSRATVGTVEAGYVVGTVPLANIVGRAERVFFSVEPISLGQPTEWFPAVRWQRMFRSIY